MILPPVTTTPEDFGDATENVLGWQQFYESLKKKHPASPPVSINEGVQEPSKIAVPPQRATELSGLYRGKPAPFWLGQLKDADPKLRSEAVGALGALAQKNKDLLPVLAASLSDKSAADVAALALGAIGPDAVPVVLPVLVEARKTRSEFTFRYAASAVGLIGPAAKEAVPIFELALKDDDWGARRPSVIALGRIGPAAKSALAGDRVESLGAYLEAA